MQVQFFFSILCSHKCGIICCVYTKKIFYRIRSRLCIHHQTQPQVCYSRILFKWAEEKRSFSKRTVILTDLLLTRTKWELVVNPQDSIFLMPVSNFQSPTFRVSAKKERSIPLSSFVQHYFPLNYTFREISFLLLDNQNERKWPLLCTPGIILPHVLNFTLYCTVFHEYSSQIFVDSNTLSKSDKICACFSISWPYYGTVYHLHGIIL